MKARRNKLPPAKAPEAKASMMPNAAPEVDEDEDLLVRTSDAAHKLRVSENTIRKYMKQGLLDRVVLGTRTIRTTKSSLTRLMGQQAAE